MNAATPLLDAENFATGFLVDEELMAGVGQETGPDTYFAYVLRHTTGEYLGYELFTALEPALQAINRIPRNWVYESLSECGGGKCGKGGCKGGKCGKSR
jgi:hypothetical protein